MRRVDREKLLFRYSLALEQGDFATMATILAAARDDAALERMILEINHAYLTEPQSSLGQPAHNGQVQEVIPMSAISLQARRPAQRMSLTLTLTLLLALFFSAVFLLQTSPTSFLPAVMQQAAPEDNVAVFVRFNEEIWNQGNVAVLGELVTPDHVRHDGGLMQDVVGIDALTQVVAGFRLAVPDFNCAVEHVVGVNDEVYASTRCTGTQSGDLYMPDGSVYAASGGSFVMETLARARFVDGKIAELWVQYNNTGWMTQIGLIPPLPDLLAEAHNAAVARAAFEGLWNYTNFDIIATAYAPEFNVYFPLTDRAQLYNHSQWRSTWIMVQTAAPDEQVTILSLVAQGDSVLLRYTATATMTGNMISPVRQRLVVGTDEVIAWEGVILYRFENGLIVEERWWWNNLYIIPYDLPQRN
ncbi:MAG: ester cyclase [Chloroflexi bacterium]|nr:ester cyclase [Chloroflexota bacterium]